MILLYHKISLERKSKSWVTPDTFYEQMLDIHPKNIVFLDEYDPHNSNQMVITFDNVDDNLLEFALPILKMFNYPFEVFLIGKYFINDSHFKSAESKNKFYSRDQLNKIVLFGGRLQWRTRSHITLSLIESEHVLEQELIIPDELRSLCPEGFNWIAYPFGESNNYYKDYVKIYFSGALAIENGDDNDRYELRRTPIFEDTDLSTLTQNNTNEEFTNKDNFKISVIIPVYNACKFVREAVKSALDQAETNEVILIEDGSTDNSLAICKDLVKEHQNVHLYRHPNGKNKGAGASRNLGIKHAANEFIAFLDADDFYLPGRFSVAMKIFQAMPDCDGVYEATGRYIENDEALQRWQKSKRPMKDLYTVRRHTSPENLSRLLLTDPSNCISPDGLVFRRRSLAKSGFMNEKLRLHQDVDFMIRLATSCNLYPGRIYEPSSKWRMHESNRISAVRTSKQIYKQEGKKVWDSPYTWCKKNSYRIERILLFYLMLYQFMSNKVINLELFSKVPSRYQSLINLCLWFFDYPKIMLESTYWKIIVYQLVNNKSLVKNSGFFNEDWYLDQNQDVAEAKIDPLIHFLEFGGQEARDPGPCFSSHWYLYNYPGVWISGINPLVHYLRMGFFEGRKPNANH